MKRTIGKAWLDASSGKTAVHWKIPHEIKGHDDGFIYILYSISPSMDCVLVLFIIEQTTTSWTCYNLIILQNRALTNLYIDIQMRDCSLLCLDRGSWSVVTFKSLLKMINILKKN